MRRFMKILFTILAIISINAMILCMAIGAIKLNDLYFAYAILCMVSAVFMFMGSILMEDKQ